MPRQPHDAIRPVSPDALQTAAGTFGLLAATARLHLVYLLAHGDQDVGALAEAVDSNVPAVSHHLAKLREAGVVTAHRHGRRQVYALTDPLIADLVRRTLAHNEQTMSRGWRRSHAHTTPQ